MAETPKLEVPQTARRIRLLRVSEGLTQAEFAVRVLGDSSDTGFKRVSRIENGQELTSDERRKIESFFTVSLEGAFLGDSALNPESELDLLSTRQYFRHHRHYIEAAVKAWPHVRDHSALKGPAEVWFFGPTEKLPVINDPDIQKRWVENLNLGVDQHLVWPLAVSTARDLKAFFDLSMHLLGKASAAETSPAAGKIFFWGCNPCAGSSNPSLARSYSEIRERFQKSAIRGLVIHPLLELPDDPRFQKILKLDTVILNRAASPTMSPYAADFLEDVGSEPNEGGRSGWLFLGRSTRSLLDEIVERLLKMVNETP